MNPVWTSAPPDSYGLCFRLQQVAEVQVSDSRLRFCKTKAVTPYLALSKWVMRQAPDRVHSHLNSCAGVKWALVLLVILNLLQLNLLYFSSQGSTRCILKAALATKARSHSAAAPAAAPMLPGSPIGSYEQLGKPVVSACHLFLVHSQDYYMRARYEHVSPYGAPQRHSWPLEPDHSWQLHLLPYLCCRAAHWAALSS